MKTVNKTLLRRAKRSICIIENGRIMDVSSCRLSEKKENRRARIKVDGKSIFRRYAIRGVERRFTHEKRMEYRYRLKNGISSLAEISLYCRTANREVKLSLGRRV